MVKEVTFLGRLKSRDHLLDNFLEVVATSPRFRSFQGIVHHSGPKAGGTLWGHVLNGIFTIEALKYFLDLGENDRRLLFAAYTMHDINKILDDSIRYAALEEKVISMAEELSIPEFMPNWRELLPQLLILIQGHAPTTGLFVSGLKSGYLYDSRLQRLLKIIQAVDKLDNSASLEETPIKDEFLRTINSLTKDGRRLRFLWHRLPEYRGLLTNLLHNAIIDEFERLGALSLLFYSEGVVYIAEEGLKLLDRREFIERASLEVINKWRSMSVTNPFRLIYPKPAGIKIDKRLFEAGFSFSKVWDLVITRVKAKKLAPLASKYWQGEETGRILSKTLEGLKTAELLRTYYIFLKEYVPAFRKGGSREKDLSWLHIYKLFQLPEDFRESCERYDSRYARHQVVAGYLERTMGPEDVFKRVNEIILKDAPHFIPTPPDFRKDELYNSLKAYLLEHLEFSWAPKETAHFEKTLKRYQERPAQACSRCGGDLPGDVLMAADTPVHLKPQQFSNRRPGGAKDPFVKKAICPLCRLQFRLEKAADPTRRTDTALYLHLFPVTYLSRGILEVIREQIQAIQSVDPEQASFLFNPEQFFKNYLAEGSIKFSGQLAKGRGLVLLRSFDHFSSGYILWPMHPPGETDTEKYWWAMLSAILIARALSIRFILSPESVPPIGSELELAMFDGFPRLLRTLFPKGHILGFGEMKELLHLLTGQNGHGGLITLKTKLYSKGGINELLMLLKGFERPLGLFWAVERLILQRSQGNDGLEINLNRELLPIIEEVLKTKKQEGKRVSVIKELAKIAKEYKIKTPQKFTRHAIQWPIHELFNALERSRVHFDKEDLQAAITETLFSRLERLLGQGYKPGETKYEGVKKYVNTFLEKLLKDQYRSDRARLLADKKDIIAAYTFYMREKSD